MSTDTSSTTVLPPVAQDYTSSSSPSSPSTATHQLVFHHEYPQLAEDEIVEDVFNNWRLSAIADVLSSHHATCARIDGITFPRVSPPSLSSASSSSSSSSSASSSSHADEETFLDIRSTGDVDIASWNIKYHYIPSDRRRTVTATLSQTYTVRHLPMDAYADDLALVSQTRADALNAMYGQLTGKGWVSAARTRTYTPTDGVGRGGPGYVRGVDRREVERVRRASLERLEKWYGMEGEPEEE